MTFMTSIIDAIGEIEDREEHNERLARIALGQRAEFLNPVEAADVAEYGFAGVMVTLAKHTEPGEAEEVFADAQKVLDHAATLGIRYVMPGDAEWPKQLDALNGVEHGGISGAPLGLWVRGGANLATFTADAVAMVGSRSATTYGNDLATDLAGALVEADMTVVSGGAFGIDQAAHRGALACGHQTVAVLACGVDRPYPQAHASLLDRIAVDGLIVSERPPGAAPTRMRFLARNRIIAALSRGTVVVEAAVRSGSLNTASWTTKIGRPLMAVPGPVTSAPSQGCHDLIRSGSARMVTRSVDVLDALR